MEVNTGESDTVIVSSFWSISKSEIGGAASSKVIIQLYETCYCNLYSSFGIVTSQTPRNSFHTFNFPIEPLFIFRLISYCFLYKTLSSVYNCYWNYCSVVPMLHFTSNVICLFNLWQTIRAHRFLRCKYLCVLADCDVMQCMLEVMCWEWCRICIYILLLSTGCLPWNALF
jgi:hypothetical protein